MKARRMKYQCVVCKTVSEHLPLRRNRTVCLKCGKKTRHLLLGVPGAPTRAPGGVVGYRPPGKTVSGKVTVTHVPVVLEPEPTETAEPSETPRSLEEKWSEEEAAVTLSGDAWADIYKMPSEAVSLALSAPQLQFSDETCSLQGVRISRFCIRHNIVLPPYLDAVPIAGRALSDYAILFAKMKARKTGKARGTMGVSAEIGPEGPPEEVKIPESSVEHVAASPGVPPDFDIDKALKATDHRKKGA